MVVGAWLLSAGLTPATATATPAFWSWAERPVMGWNSWDFYGTAINEERTKAQADYLAANLRSAGWSLITVDIQWYQPTATGFAYLSGAALTMDEWGRLIPATNRFPSAMNGAGFKSLADYLHGQGLKFGIHMMRGIPRQAVGQDTPVLGTTNTASQIADTASTCAWNSDMYGVDMTKPGAQAYYDSIMAQVAAWEVDFVKIDDLSHPYHASEIEAIRRAIDKTGRAIVFSTSPGATPVGMGTHVGQNANQWRISDDFWDGWSALYAQFQRLHDWEPYRGPGYFPDADMLPLGKIEGGSNTATGRATYFTTNEQYTLMSLWAIARSPLIHGGDMTQMDAFTLSLLTNREVIAVNQSSTHNRQLFNSGGLIAWTADAGDATNKYLAVFNTTGAAAPVPVSLFALGFTNACAVRSLWNQTDLGAVSGTFSPVLASHRGALYRLAGPSLPVPWLTAAVGGSNRVSLTWEVAAPVVAYFVKRATTETGSYVTIASGLTNAAYVDLTALNGTTYYYAVSAKVGGQESPNSAVRSATPVGVAGIVSWNYDRYGTVTGAAIAGVEPAAHWNNSYPDDPTVNLVDQQGFPTTVGIIYNSYTTWNLQSSHPGTDANGTYNKELLNGYLNSGSGSTPDTSSVSISQIPFSYYDLYVYFSSDAADRTGTVTDGTTTYGFSTLGQACISGANANLIRTTDTGTGNPPANYALFAGSTGSSKTIRCNIPLYGGLAGFQIVPRADPLPAVPIAVQTGGAGATIELSWPAGVGSVVLQKSADLQTWLPAEVQPGTNGMVISIAADCQFFRLSRP